jgi:hypothetical protein
MSGQGNGIAEAMPVDDVYAWVRNYKGDVAGCFLSQWAETGFSRG